MNTRYRNAHRWAALLFAGEGPADLLRESSAAAGSLLLNMDRLWEQVVRRMVGDAARELGGLAVRDPRAFPLTVTVDGGPTRSLRPDVLIRLPSHDTVLPVDAKYKIQKAHAIEAGDLHQLATYATDAASSASHDRAAVHHRLDPATGGTDCRTRLAGANRRCRRRRQPTSARRRQTTPTGTRSRCQRTVED
jgi:5-methylcytosine-specific restriction enzyme subunit McrC